MMTLMNKCFSFWWVGGLCVAGTAFKYFVWQVWMAFVLPKMFLGFGSQVFTWDTEGVTRQMDGVDHLLQAFQRLHPLVQAAEKDLTVDTFAAAATELANITSGPHLRALNKGK